MCRSGDLIDMIYEGSFVGVMKSVGELKVVMGFGFYVNLGEDFLGDARFV